MRKRLKGKLLFRKVNLGWTKVVGVGRLGR